MAATILKTSECTEVALGEGIKIAEKKLVEGAGALTKGAAISATEGNEVEFGDLNRALLIIENSTASEKHAKIEGGESPPGIRKGIGVLDIAMAAETVYGVYIESARHQTASGKIKITWTSATTGKVALLYLKKG